ncbi:hypothetical protein NIES22_26120 [Calothrix brevissima NIES-22]|nr:hypothetical protein NIES22_26120 [Calothrix brevissima NIES-22]
MVSGTNAEKTKHLIGLFEQMKVDEFLDYLNEDALYQFGNYPPAIGKGAIEQTVKASHLDQIKGIKFDIQNTWEAGDNVVCEMLIHYTRIDDSILTLPCTDVFLFKNGLVQEMKVFMDATPLFAPLPEPVDRLGILKQALTAVETNDVDTYITLFTEDAVYKIGNYEPVIGREGIKAFALPVMQMFKTVVHEAKNIWELGNTIVSEMNVIYTRQDDKVFTIPCLNIVTFQGDKIQKYQAFIDASPAFS